MFQSLIDVFLGCRHKRYTFPLTTNFQTRTSTVTCLDCGKTFLYDWKTMRRLGQVKGTITLTPCPVAAARKGR